MIPTHLVPTRWGFHQAIIQSMSWDKFIFWLANGAFGVFLFVECWNGNGSLAKAFISGACLTAFLYGYLLSTMSLLLDMALAAVAILEQENNAHHSKS